MNSWKEGLANVTRLFNWFLSYVETRQHRFYLSTTPANDSNKARQDEQEMAAVMQWLVCCIVALQINETTTLLAAMEQLPFQFHQVVLL